MNNTILDLRFSHNWNVRTFKGKQSGKLDCLCFSTIRIDQSKYKVGQVCRVLVETKSKVDEVRGYARIVIKNTFLKEGLTDGIAYMDTGYNRSDVLTILGRMYPDSNSKTPMCFLILKYMNEKEIAEFSKQTQIQMQHG